MDDAALVGIEWTELLIGAGLLRFLSEKLRHLPELDVLPFAVGERIDEHPPLVAAGASEGHVDDVLKRFDGLAAVANEQLGVVTRKIEPRTVGRLFDVNGRLKAERGGDPRQELDDGLGRFSHFSSPSRASVLPEPTRLTRRSAGGRGLRIFGGPISRLVDHLLPDAPDVVHDPVNHDTRGIVTKMKPSTTGMMSIIFCCIGSVPAAGIIHVCRTWVTTMSTGVM